MRSGVEPMTDALFLGELSDPLPHPGSRVSLRGPEGHHAAVVRRIRTGESVIIADGRGCAVRGPVVEVRKQEIDVEVAEVLQSPDRPRRIIVAQALAKGDRSELAIEMLTEVGVDEIWPWQSSRSIVKWAGERGEKSRTKWQACVREATKQSRRFRIPTIGPVIDSRRLADRVAEIDQTLILHEDADRPINEVELIATGSLLIIVGPEGGISGEEVAALTSAGGQSVSISDGVLRTSTAGVVAAAAVLLR